MGTALSLYMGAWTHIHKASLTFQTTHRVLNLNNQLCERLLVSVDVGDGGRNQKA